MRSDRNEGIAVLVATNANMDGDQSLSHALPAGFGQCVIEEVQGFVTDIATVVANPTLQGCSVAVLSENGVTSDLIGVVGFYPISATALAFRVSPHEKVFMRAQETIIVSFPELDTNVTPTADLAVYVRVLRLMNQAPAMSPEDLPYILVS